MEKKFKFIDLFAGIGGFHIAMHNIGGECVFASEIDENARKTYIHNFQRISPKLFESGNFNRDIRTINSNEIPDFDLLCAGFPCQPFSQAGLKRGFNDVHESERGNLFFYIAEIIKEKRPKAFFLENVRGLLNHDNGKTFKIIRKILEDELEYSFYYKIVQACDYGLPQLRPRLFIIGFRDESFMKSFSFPVTTKLKYNMSDVFGGKCDRDIGYTLRVGGRGSKIGDRRNWEFYNVGDEVKRIGVKEGKMLQGFPKEFDFPVSETQAMKQLGNSVAIDAIQAVGKSVVKCMKTLEENRKKYTLDSEKNMKKTKNKGEWTELYTFLKVLSEKKIHFGDKNKNKLEKEFIEISKVGNDNIDSEFFLENDKYYLLSKHNGAKEIINFVDYVSPEILNELKEKIKGGKGTFEINQFEIIQSGLGLSFVKGGTSWQKSDINISFNYNDLTYNNQGMSIKSYIGAKPTLLNASSNTNFIFKVDNLKNDQIDIVNSINSGSHKLKDRLSKIFELGGNLTYFGAEKENMEFNLKMIDSNFPKIIGDSLISFYVDRNNTIKKVIKAISKENDSDDLLLKTNMFKKFLLAVLLGIFPGKKWNGEFSANGAIVVKESGSILAYHIIKLESLKDYLFENIKFDTPSTTRHMFGKLYQEKDGNLYFKLNMQLRF
ncbi:HpaII family restriction endonuclease [Ornithobacterium rhinotracheale]|uniref:HpaII family restriction endonuclease n=1 Tax=Ornithobacterium rhinotracheale TaxID=28251 RepID=UPI00129C9F6A|nr:HpaII family restriction endonuclease [Ornithobacterium rhinotracheale]MRI62983.1 HpaII family restriction endonuclease [Ornithobacterium rhinotracheale]